MSSPPPNDMEGSTSPPPPVMQIPLVPSPSPLPHIPPTPAEAPVPPANSPPPIATPPVSPSPLVVVAAPSPTAISPPSNPVTSPLPPTPPISSLSPPLLLPPPSQLPPTPRAPELPPSQPGTSLPPQATPKVSPPPPPLRTPFQPSPTWPKYTPPTGHPRDPPTPPNSAVRPSSKSLPSASLPVNSKQADISTGLIAGCVIGGVLLLVVVVLVLGFICICCKNKRRRTIIQDHFKQPPSAFKPQVFPEDGLPQREDAVRVQITSGRDSNSGSSWYANPLPIQASAPHVPSTASTGTFTYDELVVATNAFSESNLIGEGGFGLVHKGFLGSGQAVAVKQLKEGSTQGEREFQAEVEIISRVHHKHLVSLIGYCIAGNKRLLVYEFVPNNTLEFHLHRNKQSVMEWATRLKIAVGSAKGLAYIHEDCNPTIIHRDIKAANILLDHNFEAKVSDFGLAKSFPLTRTGITHISTRVVGTFGYMAPEYATSGKLTEKSDVYSYGVMLLELITGYPPISEDNYVLKEGLVEWARPLLTQALEDTNFEALVDPQLEKKYNTNEMASMLACAAACVRRSSWLRPRMSQIVRVLEGDISIMDLNGGMKPGHSNMYGFDSFDSCSSYHDLFQHNMSLPKWQNGNGTTTQYGLKPFSC